jgi:hypothetical protein
LSALSDRERQIAELVSHGHTNQQIARKLCLSEKTWQGGARSSGTLLRSVVAWDEAMMRRYARACAWRARDHAVGVLRARGLDAAADALATCAALDGLAVPATALAGTLPDGINAALGYTADTAAFANGSMSLVKTVSLVKIVPYIAAHTAGCTGGPEGGLVFEERYHAEREWQSTWLAEHLGLLTT